MGYKMKGFTYPGESPLKNKNLKVNPPKMVNVFKPSSFFPKPLGMSPPYMTKLGDSYTAKGRQTYYKNFKEKLHTDAKMRREYQKSLNTGSKKLTSKKIAGGVKKLLGKATRFFGSKAFGILSLMGSTPLGASSTTNKYNKISEYQKGYDTAKRLFNERKNK